MTAINLPPAFIGPQGPPGPVSAFYTTLAARDAAGPPSSPGIMCVVDDPGFSPSIPRAYIWTGSAWKGLPAGRLDFQWQDAGFYQLTGTISTWKTLNFTLAEPRIIQLNAYITGNVVTAAITNLQVRFALPSGSFGTDFRFLWEMTAANGDTITRAGVVAMEFAAGAWAVRCEGAQVGSGAYRLNSPSQCSAFDMGTP